MIPAMVVMTPKKETIPISPTYAVNPVLKKKPPACAYGIDARRKTRVASKDVSNSSAEHFHVVPSKNNRNGNQRYNHLEHICDEV